LQPIYRNSVIFHNILCVGLPLIGKYCIADAADTIFISSGGGIARNALAGLGPPIVESEKDQK